MRELELTQNYRSLIDGDDFEKVNRFKWRFKHGYAIRTTGVPGSKKRKTLYLHHFVLGTKPKPGIEIDHINGDRLDNRKSNLRIVTTQQNRFNTPKSKGGSNYKGVSWDASRNKWRAQIMINRKKKCLGRYESQVEAATAYNKAAKRIFGEYARLNAI